MYTSPKNSRKHQGCGILLETMPEQEKINPDTTVGTPTLRRRKIIIALLALFALLVLILASKSFSWIEVKKDKEPEFNYTPTRNPAYSGTELEISALSYLGAYLGEDDQPMILAEKNSEDLLPMASLTKLMTAIVAYKNYDMEEKITIGPKVNDWPDSSKRFIPGTSFKISELLRALLIESNNDAAMALAGKMGLNNFLATMNEEARGLGIITTYYDNPVGIDPTSKKEIINYSTAKELLILAQEIINNYPEILEITSLAQYDIKTASGGFNHTAVSTDKFLADANEKLLCQGEPLKILGGKTGSTDLSKKNLLLITETPNKVGRLVTIVLSANDNFEDTSRLINWLCDSYDWPTNNNDLI